MSTQPHGKPKQKRAAAARIVAAAALSATLASTAMATTFTWNRTTATNGSWSNAANWTSSDPLVPVPTPGFPLPDGVVNDIVFSSADTTSFSSNASNDYVVNSLTFLEDDFTGSLNLSATGGIARTMYVGAGGLTANNANYNINLNTNSSRLITFALTHDQTWTLNAPSPDSGAKLLTVVGKFAGTGGLTKAGVGTLVLVMDSPDYSGPVRLNQGVVRLVGTQGQPGTGSMLGTGPVYATSDDNVTINSSGSSTYGEGDKTLENHFYLSGAGTLQLGGSYPVHFGVGSVITLQGDKTINGTKNAHQFNGLIEGPGGLTQGGGGTISLNHANTYAGPTTFANGTVRVSSPGNLGDGSAANRLVFDGGELEAAANLSTPRAITVADGGVVDTQGFDVTLGGTMTAAGTGGFRKSGTGTLTVAHARAGGALVAGEGRLVVAANGTDAGVSKVGSIATSFTNADLITTNGTLDLNDNDLVVDYAEADPSPADSIRLQLKAGRDSAWAGPGIVSTAAKDNAAGTTAIGYASAADKFGLAGADTTTWGGQTVDATSVLLKYTYYGDANLNGDVDPDDYALTDRGIATGLTGWQNGDFDYSGGAPDAADYMLLDKSFAANGGILSPDLLSQRGARFGADYVSALVASVPEPTSLMAVAAGMLALAGRRRRRQ
jgi:autotransporter-associated beta strand protein